MVKKLAIIREIFKGDHNAAAARKLRQNQISALSGTLNYENYPSKLQKENNQRIDNDKLYSNLTKYYILMVNYC